MITLSIKPAANVYSNNIEIYKLRTLSEVQYRSGV